MAVFFLFVALISLCIVGMVIVIADEYVPAQGKAHKAVKTVAKAPSVLPVVPASIPAPEITFSNMVEHDIVIPRYKSREALKADLKRRTHQIEARAKRRTQVRYSI